MQTEGRNPRTMAIDQAAALDIVTTINAEDRLVAEVVAGALPQIAAAVEAIAERLAAGGRLIYLGAGTSGRLGVLDAVECVPTFSTPPGQIVGLLAGGNAALTQSIEGSEDNEQAARDDLAALGFASRDILVGIAASGRTPYVLAGVAYAREQGAPTVGISCNAPAPLLETADIAIPLVVGPEVITGSTRMKSGTAQKMVLNMLSTGAMVRLGKVYGNLMVDVQPTNAKLERRSVGIIQQLTGLDEVAAAAMLEAAGRRVKLAVVMARRGVGADEGQRLLDEARGRLRDVIGE